MTVDLKKTLLIASTGHNYAPVIHGNGIQCKVLDRHKQVDVCTEWYAADSENW